jgi:hypothetical protein
VLNAKGPHDLEATLLYGGRLADVQRPAELHFRYHIELPRRLHRGDVHEYGIRFRIPVEQPMAPHYALVPLVTVAWLDLTIRFHPQQLPARVWRLDGVPQRVIDAPPRTGKTLTPDRFGEARVAFHDLRQGLGYGILWEFASAREASA